MLTPFQLGAASFFDCTDLRALLEGCQKNPNFRDKKPNIETLIFELDRKIGEGLESIPLTSSEQAIASKDLIGAIQSFRNRTGWRLIDAKHRIEHFQKTGK